eukprot:TRINITY_DN9231_c0_g2_i1.p1 TRINITY_DN9231_c0_g2~~TRINITY_DN9231_c0_g2_i1.p1  ORF type:complete len:377 (-),score=87.79 TRINITY_DN9231_c0_g2_i1:189-1181(-)
MADLRSFLDEKDEVNRNDKADAIFETYFGEDYKDRSFGFSEDTKLRIENRDKKIHSADLIEDMQTELLVGVCTNFRMAAIFQGCISAAIYRKRSGGNGDIPDDLFYMLRERMDPCASSWNLRHKGTAHVYTQYENGSLTILETTVAKVPLEDAINFQQCEVADDLGPDAAKLYKSRTDLEVIGPRSKICWLLLKKTLFLVKALDMVIFECGKFLEDGSFMIINASVDHPKAPPNDAKKVKRLTIEYGAMLLAPKGPDQTVVTFISTVPAGKFIKLIMETAVTKGKLVKSLKKGMEASYSRRTAHPLYHPSTSQRRFSIPNLRKPSEATPM